MNKISINNIELELDLLDADAMETYQTSLAETMEALQDAQNNTSAENQGTQVANVMRLQCRLTEKFIDKIFGEGTAEKCFPRPNHLGDHLDAFTKICSQANQAVEEAKNIANKYSGARLNREQKRLQDKRNNKNRHAAVYSAR